MKNFGRFLVPGETLVESIHLDVDPHKYTVHVVDRGDIKIGDEVIIEVMTSTEPCILIAGSPLELNVLSGAGRLVMRTLESGDEQTEALIEDDLLAVPAANTLYWYENLGQGNLVLRDHCDDFNPDNEPTLREVATALSSLNWTFKA